MKRLQISIPDELDEALVIEARRRRISKAAVVREVIAERLSAPKMPSDPMAKLIGQIDAEPGDIDDVVYGR